MGENKRKKKEKRRWEKVRQNTDGEQKKKDVREAYAWR